MAPLPKPPSPPQAEPQVDRYRPSSLRRRIVIAVLAVLTPATLIWMMFERVGAPPVQRVLPEDKPRCAEGQTEGCVGGRAEVLLVPAVPASPASLPAPRR